MSKLARITGKVFGETASATGDANNGPYIGQFGSAKLGTYNGTTDVATIQGLPAWSNGWIDAVTPNNQYPPLPERTGVDKVLSYQQCYLLQQGIAEWDSATDYHTNCFCSQDGIIYYSLANDNIGHDPSLQEGFWQPYKAEADHYLISAHIDGSTWYRLYSDGWKEQGGYIATSASEMEWGQPYLSSDGTLGGNSFAVSASSENRPAYEAFDGNGGSSVSSNGWTSSVPPAYLIFYNPTPLKVSGLDITNKMGGSGTYPSVVRAGALYGSNTNSNYTLISTFTSSAGRGATFQVDVSSTEFYKYHKLQITQTAPTRDGGTTNVMIREVKIYATYQGAGGNGVVFPISFNNTNYTFSLGFEGASGSNVYVSSKTTTGFQLSSTASGQVAWYACGY